MNNKLCSIAALFILVSAFSSFAAENSNWYFGGQYDSQKVGSTPDINLESVGINAGYRFNQFFSLETRLNTGISGRSFPFYQDEFPGAEYKEELKTQVSLFAKATYPVTQSITFYGLAGITTSKYKITTVSFSTDLEGNTTPSYPAFMKATESGLSYGIGASYRLTDSITVFLDYKVLPDLKITEASQSWKSTSLGINYFF